MDLSILNTAENPIPTHAYAAFVAVILGGIQLSRPKGTSSHKYLGYTWVLLMLWVSISSFWIQTIKIIGPFSPYPFLYPSLPYGLFLKPSGQPETETSYVTKE
jgi:uncharacterized membrane protein